MPLTTTALWPTLTGGRKAKASEVEAKFDWLEGAQLPMSGGNLTTGVYDIGSATYKWKSGHFNNIVIGGITMTSSEAGGKPIRGWASIFVAGNTITAADSFNVSSIIRNGVGDYTVAWNVDFATSQYSVVATPMLNTTTSAMIYTQTASDVRLWIQNTSYLQSDSNLNVIAVGDQT